MFLVIGKDLPGPRINWWNPTGDGGGKTPTDLVGNSLGPGWVCSLCISKMCRRLGSLGKGTSSEQGSQFALPWFEESAEIVENVYCTKPCSIPNFSHEHGMKPRNKTLWNASAQWIVQSKQATCTQRNRVGSGMRFLTILSWFPFLHDCFLNFSIPGWSCSVAFCLDVQT